MNILHLKDTQTPTAVRISWPRSRHLETDSWLFGPLGPWQDSLLHLKLKLRAAFCAEFNSQQQEIREGMRVNVQCKLLILWQNTRSVLLF